MIKQSAYLVLLIVVFLTCPLDVSLQNRSAANRAASTQVICKAQIDRAVSEYKSEISRLQTRLQKAEDQIKQSGSAHQAELTRLKNNITELNNKVASLTAENASLVSDLNATKGLHTQIETLTTEKKRLIGENGDISARLDRLNADVARLTSERDDLNKKLAARVSAGPPAANSTGGIAELTAQIESKDREIAESKALQQSLMAQCVKDPAQLLAEDGIDKRSGDTSSEYYVKYENGQKYQARDLLIGTLLFPDPSDLKFKAGDEGRISVTFRPRALGDNQTKWFVNFTFAPGEIDFPYEAAHSHKGLRREIIPGVDETWVWKTKTVSPAGFVDDVASVFVDAGYLTQDGEKSITVESRPLFLQEIVVPGFFETALKWVKENLTALLGILIGGLTLATTYLGITKVKIEKEKAGIELDMAKEKARNAELEAKVNEAVGQQETDNEAQPKRDA